MRLEVCFSGNVQGVGFRFTTVDVAPRFADVKGYVRNMPDGRVELVAEGPRAQVDRFLEAIEDRMGGYIHNMERFEGSVTGEFRDFSIRW